MPAIVSDRYRIEEARLKKSPVLRGMLAGMPKDLNVVAHGPGEPRFEFMLAANEEFRRRGGRGAESIGGVARALLALAFPEAA